LPEITSNIFLDPLGDLYRQKLGEKATYDTIEINETTKVDNAYNLVLVNEEGSTFNILTGETTNGIK